MPASWLHKPVVFFGKRLYIIFAGITSIPIWLAANEFMSGMAVHEDEAAATGVTICFFAGVFMGRYVAQILALHTLQRPRRLLIGMALFIVACLTWLFVHADHPSDKRAISLLFYWLPFISMSFTIGVLIKTVRAYTERRLTEARALAAHSESELLLLQSQLSPHFLFNTLNNMYGLSITEHEKIPPLLLRLSDLLRYSVYRSNETYVPLKNEVEYINNYIEFEKIRLGSRLNLKTEIEMPENDQVTIAPMLLIVFVENAFKHSKNTTDEKIFISLKLKIWGNIILFFVRNSHDKNKKVFDKNGGLGLDNVRKRLELLYPGAYELDIEEEDRMYSIMLHIKNKK